ncbi:MAG: dTMP kinase [Rhodospirillaceae bacterium]|nr:dTMP kinase [Rhodospirillaceae bacterium]MYH38220.1 dTMP kinase [Rhodospirillaceae bacterium]MYK13045.1 dTMP kinase [Rhodospirillaceae bacterium]
MADRKPAAGRFITVEGGEGAGKSTQIRRLATWLDGQGIETVVTREPGGTPGAEAVRALLVTGDTERWDATTEALLVSAARRDHAERLIRPGLARGAWVLCDRFADSTLAYQGYAGGLPLDGLTALTRFAVGDLTPDLTIVLDLPAEAGLARAGRRMAAGPEAETRFEGRDLRFHEAVRDGFLDIARKDPARCVVLDATAPADDVARQIAAVVEGRLLADG